MNKLRRNPVLKPYVSPRGPGEDPSSSLGRRRLDRIYLDTSALLGTGDMPDKDMPLQDLMRQLELYPKDTVFFFNIWCFGWEDIVKEVARHFDSVVHVDRYKQSSNV
ncbi:hypothetical protein Q8F55_006476 [Vanrija albida]|uniref:Uncharacterized protein n=1 Tax=Vanrija albida TaxID=181172 RepID=A0ABR3PX94_9TREE